MCGRFVITSPPAALRQIFGYIEQPNFPPRHNIAPTQPIPVVIIENGVRHFRLMRWGLLPAWVKDPRNFTLLINARAETVREKPAFKNAIRRRRCLIPADGYYEWRAEGARKRPYFIHRRDGTPIGLAGLAETWMGPNGEEQETAAIVTTTASRSISHIHDRMPVIVAPEAFDFWLDPNVDAEMASAVIQPAPDAQLEFFEVSSAVNRTANDSPALLEPLREPEVAEAVAAPAPKRVKKEKEKKDDGQASLF